MSDITPIRIGLHAVVVAMEGGEPTVLTVPRSEELDELRALPFGPFDPSRHRTLEAGLKGWVGEQTGLSLGYVEQLYTFGDRGRLRETAATTETVHFVSVGYLALARTAVKIAMKSLGWSRWYRHFPWEDWRHGCPPMIESDILPAMHEWAKDSSQEVRARRIDRLKFAFNWNGPGSSIIVGWDEERVLERYELLYEAGLVDESVADGRYDARQIANAMGEPLAHDHRRILATAIARLRGKLKYRPVVFELMPELFTLTELQLVVENLSGRRLHKQNFRRMVESSGLVEVTDKMSVGTGGRPAAYYRFRNLAMRERPLPGLRV